MTENPLDLIPGETLQEASVERNLLWLHTLIWGLLRLAADTTGVNQRALCWAVENANATLFATSLRDVEDEFARVRELYADAIDGGVL